jgi:hypothetical protein
VIFRPKASAQRGSKRDVPDAKTLRSLAAAFLGLACAALAPRPAEAFCGFYVSGAGAKLYNRSTQVVLMRDGLRTVLSMSNDYEGPPEGFAMVIPVPIVLQKENVKTLSRELFDRIDRLDSPRLVEYWELDPCRVVHEYGYEFSDDPLAAGGFGPNDATIRLRSGPARVQVLNRFSSGEYEVVILGAQDSLGLETWLKEHGYRIPSGAEAVLRPYVQSGMKFFVARVDPARVRFEDGRARLSPLRFHYDAETFALPIRLGLLSSAGTQDLIIHILAKRQRYEVANYDNVVIPTNLDVNEAARAQFGAFYAALFDRTLAERPRAVVTEYAWDSSSCDPCPGPPLEPDDAAALGAEVLPNAIPGRPSASFVLTRLHARYDKSSLGADLVFRAAPPIVGGREIRGAGGVVEQGAQAADDNFFQARYAIRHPWTGPMVCAEPRRDRWGGPPDGRPPLAAQDLAYAPRGSVNLAAFLDKALPPVTSPPHEDLAVDVPSAPPHGGCAGCRAGSAESRGVGAALGLFFTALAIFRRRARRGS